MAKVFVSYSWDSEEYKKQINLFVQRLKQRGIDIIFDGDAHLGERLPDFMETNINMCDYVLMCCTPLYKEKADARLQTNKQLSGVGYENTIITAEIYSKNNQCKFIPILFKGTWETSVPQWATSKLGIDLTKDNEEEFERLVQTLVSKEKEILVDKAEESLSDIDSVGTTGKKGQHPFIEVLTVIATIIGAVAAIATIIVALFGDNLIERVQGGGNPVSEEDSNFEDSLLQKIWEDSDYNTSTYIKNLINTGIRRYNNGEFSTAGVLFEQAIKEGDEGVTARNNLAFMMRRHEYECNSYNIENLLDQCVKSGGAFAYINYAMYLVSNDEWEKADSQFEAIAADDSEIQECISWWTKLYNRGDCEGNLVLGWLSKYGLYEDTEKTSFDYFRDVKQDYKNMPDFLYVAPDLN